MKIQIKPAEGLKVRDPFRSDFLPDDGRAVEQNSYWIRRLNEGSVTLIGNEKPVVAKLGGVKK
jgi:hypothetical protein